MTVSVCRRLGRVDGFSLYCESPENPRHILTNQFYGLRNETGGAGSPYGPPICTTPSPLFY